MDTSDIARKTISITPEIRWRVRAEVAESNSGSGIKAGDVVWLGQAVNRADRFLWRELEKAAYYFSSEEDALAIASSAKEPWYFIPKPDSIVVERGLYYPPTEARFEVEEPSNG